MPEATLSRLLLYGDSGDNFFYGDAGSDQISNVAGNKNYLYGGSDGDVFTGSNGENSIFGEGGNDLVAGGTGNDRINAGDGNDVLSGNGGNDWLSGGAGSDRMTGGADIDTVSYSAENSPVTISPNDLWDDGLAREDNVASDIENMDGGQGSDTIYGSTESNTVNGEAGYDSIIVSGDKAIDKISCGWDFDQVARGASRDIIYSDCEALY